MGIFTLAFWVYAGERTAKTFLQVALGGLVANQTGLLTVDWLGILSLALFASAGSILTSVNGYVAPTVSPELAPVPVGA